MSAAYAEQSLSESFIVYVLSASELQSVNPLKRLLVLCVVSLVIVVIIWGIFSPPPHRAS
jgi:hypothetical protein